MKKVWVILLSMMVGLTLGTSAALASPGQMAHPFKVTQEHQSPSSFATQTGWQDDITVIPLRGGSGGATGPKDGTGNKNGARNGGGTGTSQQSTLPSDGDIGLTAMRGGGGTCDGTGPKSGSGPKDGSGNKYGK